MKVIVLFIYLVVILVWAIFALVLIALGMLCGLPFDKERKIVMALSRFFARTVFSFAPLWRVKVEGAEKLDPKQTYVITVNHQSFFDIPLSFYLPIKKFKFVSKAEVRRIPIFGLILGMRDDIVIHRGTSAAAVAVMEKGLLHLKAGTSVLFFPEGTRTKDGEVHRFKDGAFRLAQEAGVAIAPCVYEGTKGLLARKRMQPRRLVVRVLDPIPAEVVKQTPAKVLADQVRELTAEALKEVRAAQKRK